MENGEDTPRKCTSCNKTQAIACFEDRFGKYYKTCQACLLLRQSKKKARQEAASAVEAKLCNSCHRTLPAAEFNGRKTCINCIDKKRAETEKRAAQAPPGMQLCSSKKMCCETDFVQGFKTSTSQLEASAMRRAHSAVSFDIHNVHLAASESEGEQEFEPQNEACANTAPEVPVATAAPPVAAAPPDVLDTALGHDDRFSQSTPIPAAMERTRGLHETHGFGASSGDLANVTAEQVGATDMQSVDLSSFPLEPAPNRLSDVQSLSFSFGDVDTFLPHLQVDEDLATSESTVEQGFEHPIHAAAPSNEACANTAPEVPVATAAPPVARRVRHCPGS